MKSGKSLGFLIRLAQAAKRTPEETKLIGDVVSVRAKYLLFGIAFVMLLAIFVPLFTMQMNLWHTTEPDVAIQAGQWKILLENSPVVCAYAVDSQAQCPASPLNPKLWKSPLLRSDKNHVEQMKEAQGREFWLGAEITPAQLREAARLRANQLMIGWINAGYHLWIDGKFINSGSRFDKEPLIVTLPMTRLYEDRPLRIAFRIIHNLEHPYPDFLNSGWGEGFASSTKALSFRGYMSFWTKARPLSLLITSTLVSLLFFLFWFASKTKQEYFYMALYSLSTAIFQLRIADFVFVSFPTTLVYAFDVYIRFVEASLGMFLGFAFARVKRVVFRIGLPVCFLLPILMLQLTPGTSERFFLTGLIGKWFVPGFYVLGASACFLQAFLMFHEKNSGSYHPVRMTRLAYFGVGMLAIGVLFWTQANAITSSTSHVYWSRFIHMSLIFLMSGIVLNEFRQQELLLQKTPVSEYHRRPVLPARISGVLLIADLKMSEKFYKQRAATGDSEDVVSLWRSHFYTSMIKFGGCVLHKKGDEVIGFFDNDKCKNAALSALYAADEMTHLSEILADDFKQQGLFPKDVPGLFFRASLSPGEIRPVWEKVGATREASWEESGNSTPFVTGARLLEFEKKLENNEGVSLLVLQDSVAGELLQSDPALTPKICARDVKMADKHGNAYVLAVYQPAKLFAIGPTKLAA